MIEVKLEGGLANTLFQMSAAISHSLKNGFDYQIPKKINNPHYLGQQVYYSPNIKYAEQASGYPAYVEPSFEYSEIPPIDNICLSGYFQSHKYFDDYRSEILKAFNFKYEMKKNVCSVHVRLDDYLDKPECHPPITKGYIFEAMMTIMTRVEDWESVKFLIFSDSQRMAKEMLASKEFQSFPIEYAERKDEIYDLELASSCQFNIGSNSAYSWWIHYLNQHENKIGVFPQIWFGSEMPHNTRDLLMPGWVTI